jgi:superfamily II DNA or RNA helicase
LGKVVDYRPRTERIAEILKLWIQETQDRRILILSERIQHLEIFEELLRPLNVPIGYYIGGMKDEDRDKTAADARVILATYAMASEAMNIKTLNAVALVSPRKKVEQSTGRILRVRPENRTLEHRILDVVDQHDLYTGQWRKRLAYYKQCHYKIYQVNEANERVALHQPKVAEVTLSGCAIADD